MNAASKLALAWTLLGVATAHAEAVRVTTGAAAGLPSPPVTASAPFCVAPWGSVVTSLTAFHATDAQVTLCADNGGGFDPRGPLLARCAVWDIATRTFVAVPAGATPTVAPGPGSIAAIASSVNITVTAAAVSVCVGLRCQKLDATMEQFVDGVTADRDPISGSIASNATGTVIVVIAKGERMAMLFDGIAGTRTAMLRPKLKSGQTIDNVAAFDDYVALHVGQQWQFFTRVGKYAFAIKGSLGAYAPLRVGAATVVATDVSHRVEFRDSKNHQVTWRVALPQLDLPAPEKSCACTVAFGQLAAGGGMPADVNAITATPDGRIVVVSQRGLALLEPASHRVRTFAFPACAP